VKNFTVNSLCRISIFLAAMTSVVAAASSADISGTWLGEIKGQDGGKGTVRFVLVQSGSQISGTAGPSDSQTPPRVYNAKLDGDHFICSADDTDANGLSLTYNFDLTIDGDQMTGKAHGHSQGRYWTLDISISRQR
jgi:hypothetical protein